MLQIILFYLSIYQKPDNKIKYKAAQMFSMLIIFILAAENEFLRSQKQIAF